MERRTVLKTALGAVLALNLGQIAVSAGEKEWMTKAKLR